MKLLLVVHGALLSSFVWLIATSNVSEIITDAWGIGWLILGTLMFWKLMQRSARARALWVKARPFAATISFIAQTAVIAYCLTLLGHQVSETRDLQSLLLATQTRTTQIANVAAAVSVTLAHNQVVGHDTQVKICIAARDANQRRATYDNFRSANDLAISRDLRPLSPPAAQEFLKRALYDKAIARNTKAIIPDECHIPFTNPVKKLRAK
jgi:hypothetical protein